MLKPARPCAKLADKSDKPSDKWLAEFSGGPVLDRPPEGSQAAALPRGSDFQSHIACYRSSVWALALIALIALIVLIVFARMSW